MIPSELRIFVYSEPVDMRLGFDRLAAAVRERLAEDPMNGALFIFANRGATRLKILWFDRNGYCLLYKRFHRAVCDLPVVEDGSKAVRIDRAGLTKLLAGVDRPHRGVKCRTLH
jgi:transposase